MFCFRMFQSICFRPSHCHEELEWASNGGYGGHSDSDGRMRIKGCIHGAYGGPQSHNVEKYENGKTKEEKMEKSAQ